MHLILKGIKGESQTIDVPDNSSVLDVKAIIMSLLGHPVFSQKLLYKGQILNDSKAISEYGIKQGETLVVIATKSKDPNIFEQNVQALIKIGVNRVEAEEVLKNFNNDLEAAKKFVIAQAMEQAEDSESDEANIVQTSGTFDFLLNSQEFLNIRDILRQNPSEFENLMSQLAVGNRDLYELIKSNIDEFLAVVGLRKSEERVEISENEERDIKELCALGFDEQDVLEAYLACEKNKELAASYLFENYQQRFD